MRGRPVDMKRRPGESDEDFARRIAAAAADRERKRRARGGQDADKSTERHERDNSMPDKSDDVDYSVRDRELSAQPTTMSPSEELRRLLLGYDGRDNSAEGRNNHFSGTFPSEGGRGEEDSSGFFSTKKPEEESSSPPTRDPDNSRWDNSESGRVGQIPGEVLGALIASHLEALLPRLAEAVSSAVVAALRASGAPVAAPPARTIGEALDEALAEADKSLESAGQVLDNSLQDKWFAPDNSAPDNSPAPSPDKSASDKSEPDTGVALRSGYLCALWDAGALSIETATRPWTPKDVFSLLEVYRAAQRKALPEDGFGVYMQWVTCYAHDQQWKPSQKSASHFFQNFHEYYGSAVPAREKWLATQVVSQWQSLTRETMMPIDTTDLET